MRQVSQVFEICFFKKLINLLFGFAVLRTALKKAENYEEFSSRKLNKQRLL
jgi:hypothetical protein